MDDSRWCQQKSPNGRENFWHNGGFLSFPLIPPNVCRNRVLLGQLVNDCDHLGDPALLVCEAVVLLGLLFLSLASLLIRSGRNNIPGRILGKLLLLQCDLLLLGDVVQPLPAQKVDMAIS